MKKQYPYLVAKRYQLKRCRQRGFKDWRRLFLLTIIFSLYFTVFFLMEYFATLQTTVFRESEAQSSEEAFFFLQRHSLILQQFRVFQVIFLLLTVVFGLCLLFQFNNSYKLLKLVRQEESQLKLLLGTPANQLVEDLLVENQMGFMTALLLGGIISGGLGLKIAKVIKYFFPYQVIGIGVYGKLVVFVFLTVVGLRFYLFLAKKREVNKVTRYYRFGE